MSLVIAHSLGKRGVEVIGCDDVEMTVLSFSRFVKQNFVHAPLQEDPEEFIRDLIAKVKKYRPDDGRPYLLMPVFRETEVIAQYRSRFEPLIQVIAPPFEAIRRVHPKDRLFSSAAELGVPVPPTWSLADTTVEEVLQEAHFPVLLKPTDQVGGRGIEMCEDATELQELLRDYRCDHYGTPLVQEFAPGDDYCLTVLFQEGELVASMAYRNLQKFPAQSGAGILRETVDDRQFLQVARDLLGPLRWHGIAEIDFRWDGEADHQPRLIEVNPRFWAGLFQSVESGLDFPWLVFQLALQGHVDPPPPVAIGKRTKVPGLWLIAAIGDLSRSEKRYNDLRQAWREARGQIENRQLRQALQTLAVSLERKGGIRDTVGALRRIIQEGRHAKNDLFYREDPFIVLGVIFILASLIRHRKLPPELTNR